MNKKKYIEGSFLVILGVITSLSLPPFNFLIVNFFTFSFFFIFLLRKLSQHDNKKIFFIYGWLFGLGYFLSNLYWISISLTFDQNFKLLIPFTIILIPAFLAIFYGLVTFFFVILKPKNFLVSFLVFSLIFGVSEFLRGSILTGFPWNLIAYSFSNQLQILSITSILGTYGFNLYCISLFTCPSLLFLENIKKKGSIVCIFFIFSLISSYIYGSSNKEKFNELLTKNLDFKVRIVGSTISLERFYESIDTISVIQDLIEISNPNINEKTIFVWPEGIIPNVSQDELIEHRSLFDGKFNEHHLFIIGINDHSINGAFEHYFNSLSLYDYKLNLLNSYNKINLVPFGEFLPYENILRKIGLKSLTNNYQSFSKGEKRNIIDLNQEKFSLKILPLICYEIIYSGKLFSNSDFDLIINISEDGWFGNSIGPKQHFVHSVFRAIETGKYVLRSANNGITAIINPLGEIEQRIELGESGYVDLQSIKNIQTTIFFKYGNKVFGLLILLYIFFIFSFNKINNE